MAFLVLGPRLGGARIPASSTGEFLVRQLPQELVKRLLRLGHGKAAQRVIGAEFDDDGVDVLRQGPAEAGGAIEGGITGDYLR